MTNDDTLRYKFEYPDQAGYPDGTGFLSQDQRVLIDEVVDEHELGIPFELVHNGTDSTYEAITGSTEVGNLRYEIIDEDRVSLLTTMVWPEFRGQGVASEIIRRVLDDLKTSGRHITIMCPIVRTFIDRNPDYESIVDPHHRGVLRVHR
jgi:predicted GNAT family acetyltransferase